MSFLNNLIEEQKKNPVKTAYQQNLSQPVQTQEKPWTTSRVMGNIAKISAYDSAKAQSMFDNLMYLRSDPSSKYYNAYATYTNKAIDELASYGVDVSKIDDDFYAKNDYRLGYLNANGSTNTPTKPGKKASAEDKANYAYYQVKLAKEDTDKARAQYNALRDDISYWATREDRNYSDDYIIDNIDWKKYGMLSNMKEKAALGKPVELNEGFDVSDDALRAMIWAARNSSSGSLYGDMARAYNGEGKVWQNNQDTVDKLNPLSDKFNPYAVGSTGKDIDEAAAYFGVPYFERDWCNQNNGMQWSNDKTEKEMWQAVYNGEQTCRSAEDALSALNQWIDDKSSKWKTKEQAEKAFNDVYDKGYVLVNVNGKRQKVDISMLKKMDDSMGRPDLNEVGNGTILNMTRPVDYKYSDYLKKIGDIGYENSKVPTDVAYVDDLDAMTGVAPVKHTDVDSAIIQDQNKNLNEAADLFDGTGTESEQTMSPNLWSAAFDVVKGDVGQTLNMIQGEFTELTQNTIKHSISKTSASILNDTEFIADFEKNVQRINELAAQAEELKAKYGDDVKYYGNGEFNPSLVNEDGSLNLERQAGWAALTEEEQDTLRTMLSYADNPDGSDVIDTISSMYKSYMDNHAAENAEAFEYSKVIEELDKASAYARENDAKYQEAIADRQSAEEERSAVIKMFQDAGMSMEDLRVFEDTNTVIDALQGFTTYDPTQWESYNAYDLYAQEMAKEGTENYANVLSEAAEGDAKNREEADRAKWILDYSDRYGIQIPDNIRNNLNRYIAKLDRDHKDYEYFALLANDDFKEGVEKGKELAINPYYDTDELDLKMVGLMKATNLMSQYEQDTYHYLYATQGRDAAEEYYNHLADGNYGALTVRSREAVEAGARDLADQGWLGRRAADIGSIITSPVAVLGSLGQYLNYGVDKLLGKDAELNPNSPWLAFNQFRTAARSEIKSEIENAYGKGTLLTTLANGLQEIIDNRGDSYMNMLTFGWLTNGIQNEMMQEFVGALPMGMSAAADAMAQAKEKGATDEQAWAIGGVTAFCESITEAISISNINNAFASGEVTADTVKGFIKDWLTKEGISEMVGESVNDILENLADEKIMGELSDHAENVQKYMAEGMTEEEAENAVWKDELAGILHTAIISYLSPGLDIVKVAPARLNYLRAQTKFAQQSGENVNLLDVMRRDTASKQTEVQNEQTETTEQVPVAETQEQTEVSSAEEASTAVPVYEADTAVEVNPEQQKAEKIAADYQILDNAGKADAASQTATIASVLQLDETDASSDMAKAAAAKLNEMVSSLPGKQLSATEWLKNLWLGASETKVSLETVKQAVTSAVLGGEQSAAYKEFQKGKFRKADFDAQVLRLAKAVEADNANQTVQDQIAKSIHEARIVEAEGKIIANGQQIGGNKINVAAKAMQAADKAAKNLMKAKENLESRQNELTAASEALNQANEDLRNNPSDDLRKRVVGAISKYNSLAAVVQEYQQSLAKAEQDNTVAQENAEKARDEALTEVRQQAEQIVAEEDQRRAGIAAEQEQMQQQEAEQMAAVEAVSNEVNNITRNEADSYIEQFYPNATEEEKQTIRDTFNRIQSEVPLNPVTRDENGQMTPEAVQRRDKFVQQISKKFGVQIDIEDTTQGGIVSRQNGKYIRSQNRIVLDQNATIDDAMFQVLGHELTHVAEQSQTYTALARTLTRIKYGYDDAQLAADIRAKKDLYDRRLAQMHEQDNSIDATPLSPEEAAQEIVADIMGDILRGDENLINRLAAEEPSTARKILNSIKSFLKKAIGMKGAWVSDAQRTVDMLEQALKESEAKRKQGRTQYSLTEGEELNEVDINAKPLVTDKEGNEIATELPGGTVAVNKVQYSLSSFNDNEQEEVRQALYNAKDENGNYRFTHNQVDAYIKDALGVASRIAADKIRLDFEVSDPNKSMFKPNSDYGGTIDASTLCAKRLVYQGTFDAIQHLLPNTPLMPEDLIHIADVMREMGYETPCGICYVESRRRNLDSYIAEWLKDFKGTENDDFIPQIQDVSTTDGLENVRKNHPETYKAFMDAMNSHGKQNNPKPVQLRTEYKGEIRDLSDKQIQKYVNHGGIRLQSFSDFETPHLLDMMQVVMDIASKNLTSQAYTKVPNFAWVFGDTGIKINLSLIGKGEGVDENGNLIFDDVEGMPFEQAMKLRDRYSKNVGTILVGINDKHILAAMADPRIDYIIPFHSSGWTKDDMKLMHTISEYTDYQNFQTEKDMATGAKTTRNKGNNLAPVGAKDDYGNGYWDFTKSGKENAETYLDICYKNKLIPVFSKFLDKGENGHYYLKKDGSTDGYWKLLIDFKMYDNDGNGSPQTAVTPNINMNQAYRVLGEYNLERKQPGENTPPAVMKDNNSLPVAQPVVERIQEEFAEKERQYAQEREERMASLGRGTAAAAFMNMTLGNTESTAEETAPSKRNQMAIDSETGERVQYSLPSDAEYLSAVERGETDKAEELVEQAAKDAGYTVHAYHGTPTGGFTVFNLENRNAGRAFGDGIYYTDNENVAKEFTTNIGRNYERVKENLNPAIYNGYLNLGENPLVIDLNQLRDENGDKPALIDYLMKQEVKNNGNNASAIVIRGIRDGSTEESTVYVLKDPTQVKSADTVTYDDNGNVIPLSERFNTSQPDIRYSLPSDNLLEQQIRQYLQRGGSVPKSNPNIGFRQWGNEGAQQSDVLSQQAKDYVLNSPYMKDTNAKELARAIEWITSNASKSDPDGYYESLRKVTSPHFNFRTKDGQARMVAMMGMAVAHDNDVNAQIELADAYNRQGTAIGQALQARKLFRLMTPEGRIAVMRKMLNDTQDEINRKGSNVELAFSQWVYDAAANATDENDFAVVQQAAAKELAEQIPSNWKDKLRGIRMLSMLGNPRTHIRNIIGNALFVPAVGLKNKLGAVAEIATGQENRTKTLSLFLNKEARQFAQEDVLKMKDTLTGEAKYNEGNLVKREQKPFKGLLQAVIDFNGNALEVEDWIFLKGHYRRALGGWMQANGYTAEQLNNNSDLLDQGRAYAIQEAQKATYRDFNKMAQTLNNVSRNGGVAGFIVDATLPFKKTPANILKRGLEYSPAGIMKSLTADIYHLKQWNDFENGKLNALPEKSISPTEFIDHICSGLAGTAVMAMGFLLANSGIVTCGLDDDDDELEKAKGNQKYAFKASILCKDITFTMDWAAPMSMPFFVGAAIQNQLSNGDDIDINEVINAFGNITEPVFNLSMLDGVNTLFKTSQYDDTNTLTQIGAKVVSNYVTSYVPSVIGAIARTIDDKQRKNFVESGKGTGIMGTFRYALKQAENKIPVLNQQNIPVRDVWGNEQTSSLAERILENFILPGYVSEYKDDQILNEIGRVYDATQDLSLMPSNPPKSFSYKNDKIVLTDKQWDAYKEQRGQTAFNMLTDLMKNPDYLNASAATQADMIKDVWSYADKMGRKAVIPDFDMVTSSVDSIAEEGKIDGYKNEMVKALQLGDIDAYETMVEALLEEEVSESDIRRKIQDTYINKYKDAYRRSDYEEMADIQEILDDSGFDFDTDAWEEAVDKKYGL